MINGSAYYYFDDFDISIHINKNLSEKNEHKYEKEIYFAFNSSKIEMRDKIVLDSILNAFPNRKKILIKGYADEKGLNDYNYKLSRIEH